MDIIGNYAGMNRCCCEITMHIKIIFNPKVESTWRRHMSQAIKIDLGHPEKYNTHKKHKNWLDLINTQDFGERQPT